MTTLDILLRIAVALIAGFAIGFERQFHHKAAGLRTNTLVALGACFYVILSAQMTEDGGDVTRIVGQVVTGIGFLGAGIIFREGPTVHGLTTAATVWCSSVVGCLAGAGYFLETGIGAGTILVVNTVLIPVDQWLDRRNSKQKS